MIGDPFGFRVNVPFRKLINTSGTLTLTSGSAFTYVLMYNCTNAGTTWSLTVQDKGTPPIVIYTISPLVVSTVPVVVVNVDAPVQMLGGIDIITAGTAGSLGLWGNYSQD
jgi:hypothetical protein